MSQEKLLCAQWKEIYITKKCLSAVSELSLCTETETSVEYCPRVLAGEAAVHVRQVL